MVIPSWERPCGVAEYSRALIDGLRRVGRQVHIITGDVADVPTMTANRRLQAVHFQYEYSLYNPVRLRPVLGALLRSGIRLAATLHSFAETPEHNTLLAEFFGRFIVHGEGIARELELTGVPRARIHVLPMGIRLYPLPPRGEIRSFLGLGGEPAIGYFGFVYPQKGLDQLALAVRRLREIYPGLRCFLFAHVAPNPGSCAAYEGLRAFLDANRLWDGLTMHSGYLPEAEVVKFLHAMDVNVLPYREYHTRQISAAVRTVMAAQRPVITSDTFPFSDLRDEVYKIADPSAAGIVDGVRAVLENPALQAALLRNIRRYAEENNWARTAARHLAIYESLGVR